MRKDKEKTLRLAAYAEEDGGAVCLMADEEGNLVAGAVLEGDSPEWNAAAIEAVGVALGKKAREEREHE